MVKVSHIFGPVPSRRLGFSLGIDPIPFKTCTLDCIYCQLGRTTHKTLVRKEYVKVKEIVDEVRAAISSGKTIDYLTFSGSGEPTLNSKIGEMIKEIKKFTSIPIAVLTNGTLLTLPEVREALKEADLVIPSLDAVTEEVFYKINRPYPSLRIKEIIAGIKEFRRIYRGKIWLEIMLVKGINDSFEELTALKEIIRDINPDKVQLNTPVRPPAESWVKVLNKKEMEEARDLLGEEVEIIAEFKRKEILAYREDIEEEIQALILRRPVTLEEISATLGVHINELIKYVEVLEKEEKVGVREYQGKRYLYSKE